MPKRTAISYCAVHRERTVLLRCVLHPRLEGISEAAHRMNQQRRRRLALDLLPQPQDVHIHRAIGDGAIAPHCIQQLLPAEDYARPRHQVFQQAVFGGRQRQFLAAQTHAAAVAIQFQAARFQDADGRRLRAELQPDARDQFAHEERLHHVIVRADLQTDDAVGFGGPRRQEDHGNVAQVRIGAELLTDLQAIAIGQHDIEQHQVRTRLPAKLQRSFAGLRVHALEAFLLQVVAKQGHQVRIVFDDYNLSHSCHSKHAARAVTGWLRGDERWIKLRPRSDSRSRARW